MNGQSMKASRKMTPGTLWHWLCTAREFDGMLSIEKPCEIASNSEKLRWLLQRAVEINGRSDWQFDEPVPEIHSLVFFPKSRRRTTMV
jgi:hypothetical protein